MSSWLLRKQLLIRARPSKGGSRVPEKDAEKSKKAGEFRDGLAANLRNETLPITQCKSRSPFQFTWGGVFLADPHIGEEIIAVEGVDVREKSAQEIDAMIHKPRSVMENLLGV